MTFPTESKASDIELDGLVKAYDGEVVLDGIDLAVEAGEFLVLVGPSGCGKSTLLRCIAGLEEITDGDLFVGGERCNDVPPKDRDLAMVFQSYALYPHMTVAENLAFSLTVRDIRREEIDRRVERAAGRLGIAELTDRYPKHLSGGQRQRVALGRAIVRNPRAFLLDEPLSNLDAALRAQMRIELKKLHRDLGATMVYVTHDQVEAMTLADRIAILDDGELQQVGTPREVFDRPANQFVAGFIGSPSMNFLDADLADDATRVAGEHFEFALPTGFDAPDLDSELVVGVRPTALSLDDAGGGSLAGTVDVIEPLGAECYLHVQSGGDEVVAELDTDAAADLTPGDDIELGVEADEVHLFEPGSGRAVRPGDPEGG